MVKDKQHGMEHGLTLEILNLNLIIPSHRYRSSVVVVVYGCFASMPLSMCVCVCVRLLVIPFPFISFKQQQQQTFLLLSWIYVHIYCKFVDLHIDLI